MKDYSTNALREAFLSYFEEKDHLRLPSASLVPYNDDSLLIINSGMAPLKPYFTGQETPPKVRVTNCQKCIRTNDIENVGKTDRHGSMFEMLGSFSFGDYFKKEAIEMAWEFLHERLEIPEEIIYVTVYTEDDEAYDLWTKHMNISEERVSRLGKEHNFWEVGIGPCGPCSEIYIDRGESFGCGLPTCAPGCDCDRYVEVWNLVFTQFYKEEDGSYTELEQKNIDTGMGLERLAVIMQNVPSFFDIDVMKSIRNKVAELADYSYGIDREKDISVRVITDHIRSVAFMIGDGILPSNEGRGYVLRRLLRRAVRHGKQLGIKKEFMPLLAEIVIEEFHVPYPELLERKSFILKLIAIEEEKFLSTLDQGNVLLSSIVKELKEIKENIFPGKDAFKLYDTYGFPIELLEEMLEENQMMVDRKGFHEEMRKQQERGRAARGKATFMGSEETIFSELDVDFHSNFTGYTSLLERDSIHFLIKEDSLVEEATVGDEVIIIAKNTPFYAESGGQMGDEGIIETDFGLVSVKDTQMVVGNKIAHMGKVVEGTIHRNDKATFLVDEEKRLATMRNHSATHLLHKALKDVLGDHVEQAGSLVGPHRLRFDYTHFSPMTEEEKIKVARAVNEAILEATNISVTHTDIETARKMGAIALFDDKYGKEVRVIQMGNSIELCGGTHVDNTSKIGHFVLLAESGIAAGVRRLECITGTDVIDFYEQQNKLQQQIATLLKASPEDMLTKLENRLEYIRILRQEVEMLKNVHSKDLSNDILAAAEEINGISTISLLLDNYNIEELKSLGDQLKAKKDNMVLTLVGKKEDQLYLLVMATDDVIKNKNVHAGQMVKELAPIAGGRGGGKPQMAQGGLADFDKIDELLAKSKEIIKNLKL